VRQHGYDAVHQVDAGAPAAGLGIDDAAFLHVVADIRDMDAHSPAPVQRLHRQRIVVVPGVGRVDGEDEQLAQVLASGQVRRGAGLGVRSASAAASTSAGNVVGSS
jgi:hypothetical protein